MTADQLRLPGGAVHLDDRVAAEIGRHFLAAYCQPAFGSLPKSEIDVLVFGLLRSFHLLPTAPNSGGEIQIFEAARLLGTTPPRLRSLLLRAGLRNIRTDLMDERLRHAITIAKLEREQDRIVIAITDPALREYARSRFEADGEVPNFQMNAERLTVSQDAFASIVEKLLTDEQKVRVSKGLKRIGLGNTLRAALKAAIVHLATRAAGEIAGRAVAGAISLGEGQLRALFQKSDSEISNAWSSVSSTSN